MNAPSHFIKNKMIATTNIQESSITSGRPQWIDHLPWVVLSDFDGTISLDDVTDHILQHLALPGADILEEQWLNGTLGSKDCLRGQIDLLRATPEQLNTIIDQVAIDPGFITFVHDCQQLGLNLNIVSDGLDYAIHRILRHHGLDFLKIAANHLHYLGTQQWQLQFPFARSDCQRGSGNCKCARVEQRHQQGMKVLYIGDGSSDYCVSAHADMVLAKGALIDYCQQQNIPHYPIQNFTQARNLLTQVLHVPLHPEYMEIYA